MVVLLPCQPTTKASPFVPRFFQAVSFAVAFFVGVTFLVVQYLAYKGLVEVNWDKISDMAVTTLDLNKDG